MEFACKGCSHFSSAAPTPSPWQQDSKDGSSWGSLSSRVHSVHTEHKRGAGVWSSHKCASRAKPGRPAGASDAWPRAALEVIRDDPQTRHTLTAVCLETRLHGKHLADIHRAGQRCGGRGRGHTRASASGEGEMCVNTPASSGLLGGSTRGLQGDEVQADTYW